MRVLGGTLKGREITTPKNLPVRPTTAFAFEALFNILNNYFDFEHIKSLDLFSGTGHISVELASRGCSQVTAVDKNIACIKHLHNINKKHQLNLTIIKQDVFRFLEQNKTSYHLIFADPPYDLTNIHEIPKLVFEKSLLEESGILVVEHGSKTKLNQLANFTEERKYGNVHFSFFKSS